MPRSPMASRTSSSLNGLMMAMTSFMDFVSTARSLPSAGLGACSVGDCARSRKGDQAQTDRREEDIGSAQANAIAQMQPPLTRFGPEVLTTLAPARGERGR